MDVPGNSENRRGERTRCVKTLIASRETAKDVFYSAQNRSRRLAVPGHLQNRLAERTHLVQTFVGDRATGTDVT